MSDQRKRLRPRRAGDHGPARELPGVPETCAPDLVELERLHEIATTDGATNAQIDTFVQAFVARGTREWLLRRARAAERAEIESGLRLARALESERRLEELTRAAQEVRKAAARTPSCRCTTCLAALALPVARPSN